MWQQTLILSVIITGSVSTWTMMVSPLVTVSRGEDAILNCSFTPRRKDYSGTITVKWLARDPKAEPFFKCSVKNDSMVRVNECSGSGLKYSLDGDPRRGQLTLHIREVHLMDNGTFFCRVELEGWGNNLQEKTDLYVEVKPQIKSLSVVEMPCGSESVTRSLRCEVEGHPQPKVVWLSVARRLLEVQGQTLATGSYSLTTCIPYQQEEEVVTCRAESRLGEAEQTYPTTNILMISLTVCGVIMLLLVLLSTGIIIYCRKPDFMQDWMDFIRHSEKRNPPWQDSEPLSDQELQTVYSEITSLGPPQVNFVQQNKEPGVVYSVSVHH